MSTVLTLETNKLRRTVLSVTSDALLAPVLIAHHFAAAVVFAAQDGPALSCAHVRTVFLVALGKSALRG